MAGLLALQHEVDTLLTVHPASEREAMKLTKQGYELDSDELDQIRVAHAWKNRFRTFQHRSLFRDDRAGPRCVASAQTARRGAPSPAPPTRGSGR